MTSRKLSLLCNNSVINIQTGTVLSHSVRNLASIRQRKRFKSSEAPQVGVSNAETCDGNKPFQDIPGPAGLPFLGSLMDYRFGRFKNVDRFQDALLTLHAEYGRILKQTIAGTTIVHIFDPDYVRSVYQHEGKTPFIPPLLETTQMYRKKRNMSPGLGNTNGEEWYRLRSAVQQMMMRPKEVTVFLPHVNQIADEFADKIERLRNKDGEVDEFKNEAAKWNLESAAMTCFETRLGYLGDSAKEEAQKMIDANTNIFSLSAKLKFSLPLYKVMMTPTWKTIIESEDFFFGTAQQFVNETADKIEKLIEKGEMNEDRYMFLGYLLSRKELSFKDVSIITLSLFSDGLGTTVPAVLFNLYCLAINPDIQQHVFEEISSVVPQKGEITPEMINKLAYLKACVKETFRFFPIGLDVARIPQKDITVGGYQIPAGTHVELNNFAMFNKPEYFSEPEKFIPERWLRGGSAHDIHPYILTPFGHGPRMCAGRRFAEQELYVLLSKILQRFRVEWHHGKMGQKFQMLMVPDCPASYSFKDRATG